MLLIYSMIRYLDSLFGEAIANKAVSEGFCSTFF